MRILILLIAVLCCGQATPQDLNRSQQTSQQIPENNEHGNQSPNNPESKTALRPSVIVQAVNDDATSLPRTNNGDEDAKGQPSSDTGVWTDLHAQWTMAFAAIVAGIFTLGQIGLAIWSIRLLKKTLNETADAARAAAKAAIAAEEANRTAREIGEAQIRAYPSINEIGGWIDMPNKLLGLNIKCKNFGESPLCNAQLIIEARTGSMQYQGVQMLSDIPPGESAGIPMTYADIKIPDSFFPTEAKGVIPIQGLSVRITVSGKDVFTKTVGTCIDITMWLRDSK